MADRAEKPEQALDDKRLITLHQAAAILGCSYWTVYRLVVDNSLPSVRLRRAIRVRRDLIEHYADYGELPADADATTTA